MRESLERWQLSWGLEKGREWAGGIWAEQIRERKHQHRSSPAMVGSRSEKGGSPMVSGSEGERELDNSRYYFKKSLLLVLYLIMLSPVPWNRNSNTGVQERGRRKYSSLNQKEWLTPKAGGSFLIPQRLLLFLWRHKHPGKHLSLLASLAAVMKVS